MPDSFINRSERLVRPALGVGRAGSATDHPHRDRRHDREHPSQQEHGHSSERRDARPPNPLRRRLYDLLFEEIDDIEALSPGQKTRIKDNIRANLTARPRSTTHHPPAPYAAEEPQASPHHPLPGKAPPPLPPASDEEDESLAQTILADPDLKVDHDGILGLTTVSDGPHLHPDEVLENARLSRQMRECLALHTERARKVAVYLHLLLGLHPDPRPHVVVDV